MAAGAPCDEAERRRDKLSLRRKEAKAISVPSNVEKYELISDDVPLVPLPVTTRYVEKTYAESDNR